MSFAICSFYLGLSIIVTPVMSSPGVIPADGDVILQSPWPWLSRPCSCLHGNNDVIICNSSSLSDGSTGTGTDSTASESGAATEGTSVVRAEGVDLEGDQDICPVHGRVNRRNSNGAEKLTASPRRPSLPCKGYSFLCESNGGADGSAESKAQRREKTPSPPLFDCAGIMQRKYVAINDEAPPEEPRGKQGKLNVVGKIMRSVSSAPSNAGELNPAMHEVAMRDTYYLLAKLALPLSCDAAKDKGRAEESNVNANKETKRVQQAEVAEASGLLNSSGDLRADGSPRSNEIEVIIHHPQNSLSKNESQSSETTTSPIETLKKFTSCRASDMSSTPYHIENLNYDGPPLQESSHDHDLALPSVEGLEPVSESATETVL